MRPMKESFSLGLFHCLWDMEKKVEALEEMKRFITLTPSDTYRQILADITSNLDGN